MEEIEFVLEHVWLESSLPSDSDSKSWRYFVCFFFVCFWSTKSSEWLCFWKGWAILWLRKPFVYQVNETVSQIIVSSSLPSNKYKNSKVHRLRDINQEVIKSMIDLNVFSISEQPNCYYSYVMDHRSSNGVRWRPPQCTGRLNGKNT